MDRGTADSAILIILNFGMEENKDDIDIVPLIQSVAEKNLSHGYSRIYTDNIKNLKYLNLKFNNQ